MSAALAPVPLGWAQMRAALPTGRSLPDDVWERRHRFIVWTVAIHSVPLFLLGWGRPDAGGALAAGIVAAVAGLAAFPTRWRGARSLLASAGLMACSGLLVWLSGGVLTFHLHFFVALAVVSLYQEWLPFVLAVLYVLVHHGVVGALDPGSVYTHAAAQAHPWRWALVHGAFVAGACLAYVVQWRLQEDLRNDAQALLDSAGEGVLGLDTEGRVAFCNPAALRMLARGSESVVGLPAAALLPGLAIPGTRGALQECTARGRDGDLPVECMVTPSVRRGRLRGHVLTFRDVSERRRAEAERALAQAQQVERMRELDQLKTRFLNAAAHELRTPLTPLGLQMELLELRMSRDGASPDDLRAVGVLRRNFDRLQALVDDLVDLSRLEAGRVTLRRRPVDLAAALADAGQTFRVQAERGGIDLSMSCEPGLWVDADPLRLQQVIVNLVANALRYTPPPGVVQVRASRAGSEAILQVRDTGRGLTPEQIQRLFQPFGQVHSEGESTGGSGLGLFIARSLVGLHGARIWVESDGPGMGCTFSVAWPTGEPPVQVVEARVAALGHELVTA